MAPSKEFLNAVETVKKLSTEPTTEELMELYGLYKQVTVGDINIEQPSFFSFREGKKWTAWNNYKGMDRFDAEVKYVITVNKLIKAYGLN